jgi:hypothetical protein
MPLQLLITDLFRQGENDLAVLHLEVGQRFRRVTRIPPGRQFRQHTLRAQCPQNGS